MRTHRYIPVVISVTESCRFGVVRVVRVSLIRVITHGRSLPI